MNYEFVWHTRGLPFESITALYGTKGLVPNSEPQMTACLIELLPDNIDPG